MAYAIFFRDEEAKITMRIPMNPEEVSTSRELETEEFSVLKLGKVVAPADVNLMEIKFESQFPAKASSLTETNNDFKGPDYYKDKFESWMKSGKAVRFICSNGITKNLSLLVLITNLDIKEVAGEEGDFIFSFSLLEYKSYSMKVLENNPSIVYKPPRPANPPTPPYNTYTIVSGDCLWNIAKRFLGDGARWPEIYNINRPPLGGNPNLIYPGQRIKIPSR